jgi:2-amino-4-hydroxy-6-hydroxymethyldihydropteridine diphosphokinase
MSRSSSQFAVGSWQSPPLPTANRQLPTYTVIIALGSNLGDRAYTLRRAIHELRGVVDVVRVSSFIETEPVDAPAGSPRFLNAVVAGVTHLPPQPLLDALLAIEARLGRRRPAPRNAPRVIDLDLILHSAHRLRTRTLTLPHPRYQEREFVMIPLRELRLPIALPPARR